MYCKCHKVNFKRGGSYTDSADWVKIEKSNNKSRNEDNKRFQYGTIFL